MAKAGDLLPLCDFVSVLIAASFSLSGYATLVDESILQPEVGNALHRLGWITAVVAPFVLYERRFAELASFGDNAALVKSYAGRLLQCLVLIGTIAFAGHWLNRVAREQLVVWLAATVLLTAGSRVLLAGYLQRLVHRKALQRAPAEPSLPRKRVVQWLQIGRQKGHIIYDDVHSLGSAASHTNGEPAHGISIASASIVERSQPSITPGLLQRGQHQRLHQAQIVAYVGDQLAVTLLADRPIKRWNALLKSSEDAVLSTILTVLLLPLLACIALAIRLDSPGPVLFKQRRHGYNNSEFDIYKFRTMRFTPEDSGESVNQTLRGDARITRVGRLLRKFSLDELPQIFNVLDGDMSLVGPRPHAVFMRTEERLGHEITDVYLHRHRVKPGITGWSQVNGSRGATYTVEQLRRRVELDIYYIENWSLLLDLKILFMTFKAVLRTTNVY